MRAWAVLGAVTIALSGAGCDYFRDDVYRITITYEAGDDAMRLIQAAWIRGANECDADDRLTTVRFVIENVPSGSDIGVPLSSSESCDWLLDARAQLLGSG